MEIKEDFKDKGAAGPGPRYFHGRCKSLRLRDTNPWNKKMVYITAPKESQMAFFNQKVTFDQINSIIQKYDCLSANSKSAVKIGSATPRTGKTDLLFCARSLTKQMEMEQVTSRLRDYSSQIESSRNDQKMFSCLASPKILDINSQKRMAHEVYSGLISSASTRPSSHHTRAPSRPVSSSNQTRLNSARSDQKNEKSKTSFQKMKELFKTEQLAPGNSKLETERKKKKGKLAPYLRAGLATVEVPDISMLKTEIKAREFLERGGFFGKDRKGKNKKYKRRESAVDVPAYSPEKQSETFKSLADQIHSNRTMPFLENGKEGGDPGSSFLRNFVSPKARMSIASGVTEKSKRPTNNPKRVRTFKREEQKAEEHAEAMLPGPDGEVRKLKGVSQMKVDAIGQESSNQRSWLDLIHHLIVSGSFSRYMSFKFNQLRNEMEAQMKKEGFMDRKQSFGSFGFTRDELGSDPHLQKVLQKVVRASGKKGTIGTVDLWSHRQKKRLWNETELTEIRKTAEKLAFYLKESDFIFEKYKKKKSDEIMARKNEAKPKKIR